MAAVNSALEFSIKTKIILAKINKQRNQFYTHLKPKQIDCLKSALQTDTIGVLPTGYGKSLIFEAIPYFLSSTVIIVSPLNSIIEEQIGRYSGAISYSEELIEKLNGDNESDENVSKFKHGDVKYLIGHPEPFISKEGFMHLRNNKLLQRTVSNIVVDEAHCVVQWGECFREKFREIKLLRSLFPSAKMLALTATATNKMVKEIATHLSMKAHTTIAAPMDRSNIKISVLKRTPNCGANNTVEDSYYQIFKPLVDELQVLQESFPKTVVYTKLKWCGYGHEVAVKDCPAEGLKQSVAQYHSPCTKNMRSQVLKSMADPNGQVKLLFATEAYSMGTDAPDIRRIIHAGVPGTLETYIQEIGRAGRDGLQANAVLYFNNSDISTAAKVTDEIREFCMTKQCRREYLCQHFGSQLDKKFLFQHDCCDNCECHCNCDFCLCRETTNMKSGSESDVSMSLEEEEESSYSDRVSCIFQALMDYFTLENANSGPTGSLNTGLSEKLAKDIADNFTCYTFENISCHFPKLNSCVAENIVAIIDQCNTLHAG